MVLTASKSSYLHQPDNPLKYPNTRVFIYILG